MVVMMIELITMITLLSWRESYLMKKITETGVEVMIWIELVKHRTHW